MASTRTFAVHDNLIEGVDTTLPAQLIGQKWHIQHNFRLTPTLTQIPHKVVYTTTGSEDILSIAFLPSGTSGYGQIVLFTPTAVRSWSGYVFATGLPSSAAFRKWSIVLYNNQLYYGHDLTPIRRNDGSTDVALANAPKAKYITVWYDHLVAANVTVSGVTMSSRLMLSDLYDFTKWTPTSTNEADFYDFVEWQQPDFPFVGITGVGKLGGTLWVYTPTAIIPLRYIGLPKVFSVVEDQILSRVGNTFPYTLVTLDKVHFFYDAIEGMFWAFDGTLSPIGEPIRTWILTHINTNLSLAQKMYGYVDVDNREIWWVYVSTASSGAFDQAVVFNYRYKKWFTASVEGYFCFAEGTRLATQVRDLVGMVSAQTGTVANLGLVDTALPRFFGGAAGKIYREELTTDLLATIVTMDDPMLETADFHYGDIRTIKENDSMVVNATWSNDVAGITGLQIMVRGRDFLGENITWAAGDVVGTWLPTLQDNLLDYPAKFGRILRYRFTGKSMRFMQMSAFSDMVRAKAAEK